MYVIKCYKDFRFVFLLNNVRNNTDSRVMKDVKFGMTNEIIKVYTIVNIFLEMSVVITNNCKK